ncbi:Wzz/FepE/Etk N-terminal domain-containing protein [Nocardioides sp. GY 10113]|uniref:Wzz/FepE/Etk N-terminal domain-containing protein n=1 Tax=Nocardioides sp. GY 10113 TaxID=2569761 RepID=UPI00145827FA|nr:Wzz/FepE/Etk N-terminal domain-containing protein [Nocardioides sp. GY 10113]
MTESPDSGSLDLGRYWAIVKTRWKVVLAVTMLATVLAGVYATLTPTTYTATAQVNLSVIADQPFNTQRAASGLIDPATEVQLAKSSAVLTAAAGEIGDGATVADVRRATTVTVLPDTTVARITYTAPTLDGALTGADAVSTAIVDYRTQVAEGKVQRISDRLTTKQNEVNKELAKVNEALDSSPASSAAHAVAMSRRTVLEAQLGTLVDQVGAMNSIDTSGGYVITEAGDTTVGVKPHTRMIVQIGLAAGVVLGLIAAFVVNALDRRVATAHDVTKARGGPLLARLSDPTRAVPASIADLDGYWRAAERLLATPTTGQRATTVVDLTSQERPTVAINLALGLASSAEAAVVVVLAEGEEEFARELADEHGGVTVPSPVPQVGRLALRFGPETPSGTSSAAGTKEGAAEEPPACVLVAMPSSASRAAVLAAARRTGSAVAVVEARRTTQGAVRALSDDLAGVGAAMLGTLLAARGPRRRGVERGAGRRVAGEARVALAADGV